MYTSLNPKLRRGVAALAAVAAVGISAGAVGASHSDIPTEWPDPVRERAHKAFAYCDDPAAAAAAGFNVIVGAGFIVGTVNNDLIIASPLADTVSGLAGDDILCLYGRGDRGSGGPGNDVVLGMNGNDRLQGNLGDDILIGGPGVDACNGGPGVNFVSC